MLLENKALWEGSWNLTLSHFGLFYSSSFICGSHKDWTNLWQSLTNLTKFSSHQLDLPIIADRHCLQKRSPFRGEPYRFRRVESSVPEISLEKARKCPTDALHLCRNVTENDIL